MNFQTKGKIKSSNTRTSQGSTKHLTLGTCQKKVMKAIWNICRSYLRNRYWHEPRLQYWPWIPPSHTILIWDNGTTKVVIINQESWGRIKAAMLPVWTKKTGAIVKPETGDYNPEPRRKWSVICTKFFLTYRIFLKCEFITSTTTLHKNDAQRWVTFNLQLN